MKWKDVKLGLKGIPMPGDECNELAFLALIARRTENQEVLAKLSTHRLWRIRKWVARRIEDQEILWKMYSAEHTNGDSSDAVIEWVARRIKDQDRLWSMRNYEWSMGDHKYDECVRAMIVKRIKDEGRLWQYMIASTFSWCMANQYVRRLSPDSLWRYFSNTIMANSSDDTRESTACIVYIVNNVHD